MSLGSFALLKWIQAQEMLHARTHSTFATLAGLKVKGRYTRAKGRAAFGKLVRAAADSYVKNGMTPLSATEAFPASCRAAATGELEKEFAARFKGGQWTELQQEQKASDAAKRKRKREKAKRTSQSAGKAKMPRHQRLKRLLG